MRWFRYVQEVLRVATPKLVFLSGVCDSLSSTSRDSPLVIKLLLDRVWQLDQVDGFGCENSQEEGSFRFGFLLNLCIRNDDIVAWLLVVSGGKPDSASNLSLGKALATFGSLQHDVVPVDFPKAIALRSDSYNHEVNRNVGSLASVHILLHQRDYHLSLLLHTQAVLRVVEPLVIGVQVNH